jgi:hypothetical protein
MLSRDKNLRQEDMAWVERRVVAEVSLHFREDGSPQKPPCIFAGYRNSHIRLDSLNGKECWGVFFPLTRNRPAAGETGWVRIALYGPPEELNEAAFPGATFSFSEGGCRLAAPR